MSGKNSEKSSARSSKSARSGIAPIAISPPVRLACSPVVSARLASSSGVQRHNKIYRTPVTPPPPHLENQERGFTLDCIAVSSISGDYYRTNPKLGPVIPPYNSQFDRHTRAYFGNIGVDRTLRRTRQHNGGCSLDGPVMDAFFGTGKGFQYLSSRNAHGAGQSREFVDGHGQFMKGILPLIGYNGKFGYRRNTPWLRATPSPFGTGSASPCY